MSTNWKYLLEVEKAAEECADTIDNISAIPYYRYRMILTKAYIVGASWQKEQMEAALEAKDAEIAELKKLLAEAQRSLELVLKLLPNCKR